MTEGSYVKAMVAISDLEIYAFCLSGISIYALSNQSLHRKIIQICAHGSSLKINFYIVLFVA